MLSGETQGRVEGAGDADGFGFGRDFGDGFDPKDGGLSFEDAFSRHSSDAGRNGDSVVDFLSRGDAVVEVALEIEAARGEIRAESSKFFIGGDGDGHGNVHGKVSRESEIFSSIRHFFICPQIRSMVSYSFLLTSVHLCGNLNFGGEEIFYHEDTKGRRKESMKNAK